MKGKKKKSAKLPREPKLSDNASLTFLQKCHWFEKGDMYGPLSFKDFLRVQYTNVFNGQYPPLHLENNQIKMIISYKLQIRDYSSRGVEPNPKLKQNYKAAMKMIDEGDKAIPHFHKDSRQLFKIENEANLTKEKKMAAKKGKTKGKTASKGKGKSKGKATGTTKKGSKRQLACELLIRNSKDKLTDEQIAAKVNKAYSDGAKFDNKRVSSVRGKLNRGVIKNFPGKKNLENYGSKKASPAKGKGKKGKKSAKVSKKKK